MLEALNEFLSWLYVEEGMSLSAHLPKSQQKKEIEDFFAFARANPGDPRALRGVVKGLLVIFANQEESEQTMEATIKNNGKGFMPHDARFGSSLAKQFKDRGTLTIRQVECAAKMLKRYTRQLMEASRS